MKLHFFRSLISHRIVEPTKSNSAVYKTVLNNISWCSVWESESVFIFIWTRRENVTSCRRSRRRSRLSSKREFWRTPSPLVCSSRRQLFSPIFRHRFDSTCRALLVCVPESRKAINWKVIIPCCDVIMKLQKEGSSKYITNFINLKHIVDQSFSLLSFSLFKLHTDSKLNLKRVKNVKKCSWILPVRVLNYIFCSF